MLTKTKNIRKKIPIFFSKAKKKNYGEYVSGEATTKIWKKSMQ